MSDDVLPRIFAELTALHGSVDRLAAGQQELVGNQQQLAASQQELVASHRELLASQQALIASHRELAINQQQLAADQQALHGQFTHLDISQTRLRTDVMDKLEQVADQLTSIRSDIAVNFSRADMVQRHGEHTRDEVRELSELVAQLHRRQLQHSTDIAELRKRLDS